MVFWKFFTWFLFWLWAFRKSAKEGYNFLLTNKNTANQQKVGSTLIFCVVSKDTLPTDLINIILYHMRKDCGWLFQNCKRNCKKKTPNRTLELISTFAILLHGAKLHEDQIVDFPKNIYWIGLRASLANLRLPIWSVRHT